jgi:hypothetical protein
MTSNCRAKERAGSKASDDTSGNPAIARVSAGRRNNCGCEKRNRGNGSNPNRTHFLVLHYRSKKVWAAFARTSLRKINMRRAWLLPPSLRGSP